jgi:diaminopimelate epimerase
LLDPTGNLTCLVLDRVEKEEEAALTKGLLSLCEQVAYLEPPVLPETIARIRLMGGEFCGNAAMAAAVWLMRDWASEEKTLSLLLEVSGTVNPVLCKVWKKDDGYEGSVKMPGVPEISPAVFCGIRFVQARMQGIVHLIYEGENLATDQAEGLLRTIAEQIPDDAVGLLQWNREKQYMIPLVYVRGSQSMVWEHGCGSGSAAIGAYEALRLQDRPAALTGMVRTEVVQPGGTIQAVAETAGKSVISVSITGKVRFGEKIEIFH